MKFDDKKISVSADVKANYKRLPPERLSAWQLCWEEGGDENSSAELPCSSCGKMVMVGLPHHGCVFCDNCMWGDGTLAYGESEEGKSL